MQMKSVVVDKIGSIAQACGLGHELRVATTDIPCEEGVVLVVEVLTNKSTYNQLELTSGRMAKVSKGDVIVGALGHRQALFGYSGHIPTGASRSTRACSAVCCSFRSSASVSACRPASVITGWTRERRSTRTACRSWRLPAPAWRLARRPLPARS